MIFLSDMFLIFRQLSLADMSQTIVLVMLREVESDLLAIDRDAHGDETVDEFIAQPAHGESIEEHDDDGQQMVEEDDKTIPRAGNKSFLNEDTRQHRAEDTTRAVGGEHIEGVVDAGVRTPIDGNVTDNGNDQGDEDALTNGNITGRGRDGYQTDYATNGGTHG